MQTMFSLSDESIEWIIPGTDWPLAGTHRGHDGLERLLRKTSEIEISSPTPPEYVAQGDRVLVVGGAGGTYPSA
jgi:ketosteroid isomerase-like protein